MFFIVVPPIHIYGLGNCRQQATDEVQLPSVESDHITIRTSCADIVCGIEDS